MAKVARASAPRWSIEELEGVHESIMASTHIDLLIDSSMKKCGSVHVGTICNTLGVDHARVSTAVPVD